MLEAKIPEEKPATLSDVLEDSADLTARQQKFIDAYRISGNASLAAKQAGYSAKSAGVEGCRLLKNAKVVSYLEKLRKIDVSKMTKETFIERAWEKFDSEAVIEPIKPRYLEIAGKALGFLGGERSGSSTTNNVLILNADVSNAPPSELWEQTRRLLGA